MQLIRISYNKIIIYYYYLFINIINKSFNNFINALNIKNYSQKSELYLINTKSNNNNLHQI